jgi:phenol/toluene 2-monooxygenase (NADH) P1/A1
VQYELRQRVIDPQRKTFQNIIDRQGDRPASRYEEGTLDVQPTENFHYRPLWDPAHELYDESYSAVRLTDSYSFRDPRQFYYAPYVSTRAAMHEAFGKTLTYIEDRDLLTKLPSGWRAMMAAVLVPLRHYESGAQLISVTGARFAYGTSVEQCLSYSAFDRIGNAQMLSRIGIAMADGIADLLAEAKQSWVSATQLQPLRRMVEELLVESDWVTSTIGLDLVDRLLYPLLYRHLDEAALMGGAGSYSLLSQHFSGWFDDQRKWLDALVAEWVKDENHGPTNADHLSTMVATWLPRAEEAVKAIAARIDADAGADAIGYLDAHRKTVADDLAAQGLRLTNTGAEA